jgi:hypothetical protein
VKRAKKNAWAVDSVGPGVDRVKLGNTRARTDSGMMTAR